MDSAAMASGERRKNDPAAASPPVFGRYELGEELGRGATGTVYEARDRESNAVVAIKTITSMDPENLFRLKHEFRSLANLEHANFVRFGELACERGQWFFTMERVFGTDFVRHARPNGALDETRLRAALSQLVESLEALHEAGRLHRDVKPSNVLVSEQGRVVLLDFGLISAFGAEEAIRGTPAYMAPEQIECASLTAAADWYAVGVLLFECLTGALPFTGAGGDLLTAKLTDEVRAGWGAGCPADLRDLAATLLQREPTVRPGILEIRNRLGMQARATAGREAFVGRERELSVLGDAFVRAKTDATQVLVRGEPGMGKSALVERFLAGIPAHAIVLRGRCYEQETVPFAGIDSLIDALSDYLLGLRESEVARLLSAGVSNVAKVFPVLTRVPSIAAMTTDGTVPNPATLREQAFGELGEILAALGRSRTLVVYLDDMQWLGSDGLALVRTVFGSGRTRFLFVATIRSGMAPPPDVAAFAEGIEATIEVQRLTAEESLALCNELGATDAETRDAVLREAGGHPIFLAELLRSAHAGTLSMHANARLEDVLRERVAGRDAIERRFIEMAMLAGAPTPYAVLAQAAGLDVGECFTRLARLRAVHLLRVSRVDGERCVEPYHDRLRAAVMECLRERGEAHVAREHLALGRALRDARKEAPTAPRVFAIVQHLNMGRAEMASLDERQTLARLDLVASREAWLATSYERATEYARIGLDCVPSGGDPTLRRDLLIARFQAEYLGGDPGSAQATFAEARALAPDPHSIADVYVAWLDCLGVQDPPRSVESAREAVRALGMPLPRRASMTHVLLEFVGARWAQGRRTPDVLEGLPAVTDPKVAGVTRVLTTVLPAAYFLLDEPAFRDLVFTRLARISLRHGISGSTGYAFAAFGLLLGAMGRHDEALAFGRLAKHVGTRHSDPHVSYKVGFIDSFFLIPLERPFAAAREALAEATAQSAKAGDAMYEVFCSETVALTEFYEGESIQRLRDRAEWSLRIAERRKNHGQATLSEALSRYAAALAAPDTGTFEQAAAAFDAAPIFGSMDPRETAMGRFIYNMCRADFAWLMVGSDEARAAFEAAETLKNVAFGSPNITEHAFMQGLLAADRARHRPWSLGTWLTLRSCIRRLDALSKGCPVNYEAYALILRAERLRAQRRARAATEAYDRAIAAAERHAMPKREAIACELAAAHAHAQGDGAAAERHRLRAIDAYRRWGAHAKARMLEASR